MSQQNVSVDTPSCDAVGPVRFRSQPIPWGGDTLEVRYGSENLGEVERFRYSIYVVEQGKVLPSTDHVRRRLPDPEDHSAFHFCVRSRSGEIVAYARMHYAAAIPNSEIVRLDLCDLVRESPRSLGFLSKLMICPSLRGRTTAVRLISTVIQYGCEWFSEAEGAIGHCSMELVSFYTRLGFRPFGAAFVDPIVGRQVPMVAIFRDVEHFRQCRSPLLSLATSLPRQNKAEDSRFRNYFLIDRAFRDDGATQATVSSTG